MLNVGQIVSYATSLGVDLAVSETSGTIELWWIERTTGDIGAGENVLTELCQYADRNGKTILLDHDVSNSRIADYYRFFGFDDLDVAEIVPRHDWRNSLSRRPKLPTPVYG